MVDGTVRSAYSALWHEQNAQAIYQSKYQIYNLCLPFIGVLVFSILCYTHQCSVRCKRPSNKRVSIRCRIEIFISNWTYFSYIVLFRMCDVRAFLRVCVCVCVAGDTHIACHNNCKRIVEISSSFLFQSTNSVCWQTAVKTPRPDSLFHSSFGSQCVASCVYKILMSFDVRIPMRLF